MRYGIILKNKKHMSLTLSVLLTMGLFFLWVHSAAATGTEDFRVDLYYSQKNLAHMLQEAEENENNANFMYVNEEMNVVQDDTEPLSLEAMQLKWLDNILEGTVVLKEESLDGLTAVTALDIDRRQLLVAIINNVDAHNELSILIEERTHEMSGTVQQYEFVPKQEEDSQTGRSEGIESGHNSQSAESADFTAKEDLLSIETIEGDPEEELYSVGSVDAEQIEDSSSSESMEAEPEKNSFSAEHLQTELENGLGSVETVESEIVKDSRDVIYSEVEFGEKQYLDQVGQGVMLTAVPNGATLLTVDTGFMEGGDISNVSLEAGMRNASNGAHGVLRLYSKGDAESESGYIPESIGNYATYSGTGHSLFFYEINSESEIILSNKYHSQRNFTIELRNSLPVTIKRFDADRQENADAAVQYIEAVTEGAVIRIHNPEGRAVNLKRRMIFTGPGSAKVIGTGDYAISHNTSFTAILGSENGFSLEAYSENGAIRVNRHIYALDRGDIIGDAGGNDDTVAIYAGCDVNAATKGRVMGQNAGTGISASRVMAYDGDITDYATAASVDDSEKSRIVGYGSDTGIMIRGDLGVTDGITSFFGRGSLVYGNGDNFGIWQKGTLKSYATYPMHDSKIGQPHVFNNTHHTEQYKAKGTVIGVADGSEGVGYYFTTNVNTFNIYDAGTRFIAVGGKYGMQWQQSWAEDYFQPQKNVELIAIGGEYGYYSSSTTMRGYLKVTYGAKVYAYGGTVGVQMNFGRVATYRSGARNSQEFLNYPDAKIIGIGGIPREYMEDTPYNNVEYMLSHTFKFDDLPEPKRDERGLLKIYDEDGKLPDQFLGTYGIRTGGGDTAYIASYDIDSVVKGFGGEYGLSTRYQHASQNREGTYLVAYYGGYLEGAGGRIGGESATYVHVWSKRATSMEYNSGNSTLKGYGKEVGIDSKTYFTTEGARGGTYQGIGYVYGYGETNGLRAGTEFKVYEGGVVVGETVADASKHGDHPHAQPAVASGTVTGYWRDPSYTQQGIMHEMYNVINYEIVSMPPYALNHEIEAIATNMGKNPETLLRLNWTTPVIEPQKDPITGQDYMNYDPDDDQNLVKPGFIDAVDLTDPRVRNGKLTGLIAYGNAKDVTLVGNCHGTVASMMAKNGTYGGGENGKFSSGTSYDNGGLGHYRITLRGIQIKTSNTMNVEFNLKENYLHEISDLAKIPVGTYFELKYRNLDAVTGEDIEAPVAVNLNEEDVIDLETGKIHLTKLRMGHYWLEPIQDIGNPFEDMPIIHFECKLDTSADVPDPKPPTQYPNYDDYWYEKVFLCDTIDEHQENKIPSIQDENGVITALLNPDELDQQGNPYPYAKIKETGSKFESGDDRGKGKPTIDPNLYEFSYDPEDPQSKPYDVEARRLGKIELYYFRTKYELQFNLKDIDSHEILPGSFELKAYRDGAHVSFLDTDLRSEIDTDGNIVWNIVKIYPDLEYHLKQRTVDRVPYLSMSEVYQSVFRYKDNMYSIEAEDAEYYDSFTDQEGTPHYYINAYNDQPSVNSTLHLLDKEMYDADPRQSVQALVPGSHITGGGFKLLEEYISDPGNLHDVSEKYLQDNEDGTFSIILKPGRSKYVLEQNLEPIGYQVRTMPSQFIAASWQYNYNNTNIVGYNIKNLNEILEDDDTGWVEPHGKNTEDNWDKQSIWITNEKGTVHFKFIKTDKANNPLSGAEFALYTCSSTEDGHIHDSLAKEDSCWNLEDILKAESNENGIVDFGQISFGEYMLAETRAPDRYQLPAGQWLVKVEKKDIQFIGKSDHAMPPSFVKIEDEDGDIIGYSVPNYAKGVLPDAGGTGILYTVITGFVLLAFVLIIKMRNKDTQK